MKRNKYLNWFYSLPFFILTNTAWAGEAAHQASEHAEEGEHHLPNVINVLHHFFPHQSFITFLHDWENIFFSFLVAVLIAVAGFLASRKRALIPSGIQNVFEVAVEGLDNFVCGILGDRGREFTPFVGTLWLYIFFMNFIGILPMMKSSTSSFGITFPLGLAVFLYVQYTGISKLGLFRYFDHLAGEPRNTVGFVLIPLMLFLHVVGELVKPLSLSLRLFGNIWGEDVLLSVFVSMGSKIFFPLHFPFLFLALLTSFVQATVFCLLTTIYISLMLPHDEHEHEEAHGGGEAHAQGPSHEHAHVESSHGV